MILIVPVADLTATATLILAGITLALVAATVTLVCATRAGTNQARRDAQREIDVMQRQLEAEYRPLLIEVLPTGPILPDMGARPSPNVAAHRQDEQPLTIEIKFGQTAGVEFDPRLVYMRLEGGAVYLSVPLRNVGRGLAVIDSSSIDLHGVALGSVRERMARRQRVPVGETTRIEVISHYQVGVQIGQAKDWSLHVRYVDFAGEQRTHATIRLECPDGPQGPWYVVGVDQEPVPGD